MPLLVVTTLVTVFQKTGAARLVAVFNTNPSQSDPNAGLMRQIIHGGLTYDDPIEVTMLAYPRNLEGSLTILGEKGSAKIGGTAVNKIEHWEFAEPDDDDKLVEAANTNPPNVYGLGHQGYYRNVLSVLRGEAKPDTDGRAGRKSLELILGIYESAKTGREVPLPLRAQV